MYKQFKRVDINITNKLHFETYSNDKLMIYVDRIRDTIRIAKITNIDTWCNLDIVSTLIPYSQLEYSEFETLILELQNINESAEYLLKSTHIKLRFN